VGFGGSAWLAGTGFLFSNKVKKENGGWPFHTLTEDIEFMVESVLRGTRVGYAEDAEFFDEQPVRFSDSFFQRLRWAKGGLQVFQKYWKRMIARSMRLDFSVLDYTISIAPAYVLTVLAVLFNMVGIAITLVSGTFLQVLPLLLSMLIGVVSLIVLASTVTVVCEWKKIRASAWKKICSIFAFVPFMLTYVPIALIAMVCPVRWRVTKHQSKRKIEDLMP
jgi:cellulose synthase/poly-beta-1,6-N-acetylglucosamine synthase-like glycosyltransferase